MIIWLRISCMLHGSLSSDTSCFCTSSCRQRSCAGKRPSSKHRVSSLILDAMVCSTLTTVLNVSDPIPGVICTNHAWPQNAHLKILHSLQNELPGQLFSHYVLPSPSSMASLLLLHLRVQCRFPFPCWHQGAQFRTHQMCFPHQVCLFILTFTLTLAQLRLCRLSALTLS